MKDSDYLFKAAQLINEIIPEIPVNQAFGTVLSHFAVDKDEPNGAVDAEQVKQFIEKNPNPKSLVNELFGKMCQLDIGVLDVEDCFEKIREKFSEVREKHQK